MNYKITYTKRFIKNLKRLNAAGRAQLKKKLPDMPVELVDERCIRRCAQSVFKAR